MGNNYGVILVTVGLNLLSENLKVLAGSWVMIYGILIMATIALAPGGLPELAAKLRRRFGLRRARTRAKRRLRHRR